MSAGTTVTVTGLRRMPVDIAVRVFAVWDEEFRATDRNGPRGRREPTDLHPGLCLPGHSYPMTPLNVKNTGDSPMEVTYSANPGYAMTWLKISPVEILPGESASVPVTLAVPSNAGSGEGYVILTAGEPASTSGSASGSPLLASASRPGINLPREPALGVLVADSSRGNRPRGLLGTEEAGRKSMNSSCAENSSRI